MMNGNEKLMVYLMRYCKVKEKAEGHGLELETEKNLILKSAFTKSKNS